MNLPSWKKLGRAIAALTDTQPDTKTSVPKVYRALIVEDNHDDAFFIEHLLRAEGWDYRWARSPREADDLIRINTFDLIILDVAFPNDRTGYRYAEDLEAAPVTENIPIVFVTGDPDTFIRCTKPGVYVAYIIKPPKLEALRRAMKVANGLNGSKKVSVQKQSPAAVAIAIWILLTAILVIGISIGNGKLFTILEKLIK